MNPQRRIFGGDGAAGPGGWHARRPIHAGLVCLNSIIGMDLGLHEDLFRLALQELTSNPDLVNIALELTMLDDDDVDVIRYEIVLTSICETNSQAVSRSFRRRRPGSARHIRPPTNRP
jgi:hypothetical protein